MRAIFFAAALVLAACSAAEPGALEVRDAWAAPTPNGVDVAAGFLTIANPTGEPDRLLAASSPRAARVEVHEMTMTDGVMQMRRVEALAVAANGEAVLAPGGAHLMFYGVAQPFVEGEEISVQLTFEHAGAVNVMLPVRNQLTGHGGGH